MVFILSGHGFGRCLKENTDSIVVRLGSCIFMQCKEGYDEAWHEKTCQIGLCDFISVSLYHSPVFALSILSIGYFLNRKRK